jgi:hypothetical protein
MIRIDALAWVFVLALLGVGLFQVKYEVQAREIELRQLRKQVEANYAAIRVLDAEWSYLNDLERLSDLARRHTDLAPTTPSQIHEFADLPARPPEVREIDPSAPLLLGEAESAAPEPRSGAGDEMIDAILADMRGQALPSGEAPLPAPIAAETQ